MDLLLPEEMEYLEGEAAQDHRCGACGHLIVLHIYYGGVDRCVICGCE